MVKAEHLSHDPAVFDGYTSDPLVKMAGSLKALHDMLSHVILCVILYECVKSITLSRAIGSYAPATLNGQRRLPFVDHIHDIMII